MVKMNKTQTCDKVSSRARHRNTFTRRLRFEGLEERELLYAAGSYAELCDAIDAANSHPNNMGQDYIDITANITLTDELPVITEGVEIRSNVSGTRRVINGNGACWGFEVNIATSLPDQWATFTIRDLELKNIHWDAVDIQLHVNIVEVDNCRIHDNWCSGVKIASTENAKSIKISNSYLYNNSVGISHKGDTDSFEITNCKIGAWQAAYPNRGNTGNGIYIQGTGPLKVSGSTISGNGGNGIAISRSGASTDNLQIVSDEIWGQNKIGFDENGAFQLPNLQNGISISGWTGSTSWTSRIDDNLIGANGYDGIKLNNCQRIKVISNTLTNNQGNGIRLSGTTSDIRVGESSHGNTIEINGSTSSYHGVKLEGSASSISVSYNTFDSNVGEAIATSSADSHNVTISRNVYDGQGTAPVSLYAGSNHGIKSAVIDIPGILKNGNYWTVPFSIDPCGGVFAGQSLVVEVYKCSPTGVYTYITGPSKTFDAEGGYCGCLSFSTSSFAAGDQIAVLVRCTAGTAIGDTSEFSNVAMIQDTPPRVVGVALGNLAGTSSDVIAPAADSDAQLRTVRVPTVRKVSITFSRNDVQTDENALTVVSSDGLTTIAADDAAISWSPDRYTATWTLDSNLPSWECYIVLDEDSVLTPTGTKLDGEWTNPLYFTDNENNSAFPSGDGVAGGDFQFAFTHLLADANRDGIVNSTDASALALHWKQSGCAWEDGDFNGDTIVDERDASILASHWFLQAWQPPALLSGFNDSDAEDSVMAALDTLFAEYGLTTTDDADDMTSDSERWDLLVDELLGILSAEAFQSAA